MLTGALCTSFGLRRNVSAGARCCPGLGGRWVIASRHRSLVHRNHSPNLRIWCVEGVPGHRPWFLENSARHILGESTPTVWLPRGCGVVPASGTRRATSQLVRNPGVSSRRICRERDATEHPLVGRDGHHAPGYALCAWLAVAHPEHPRSKDAQVLPVPRMENPLRGGGDNRRGDPRSPPHPLGACTARTASLRVVLEFVGQSTRRGGRCRLFDMTGF